VDASKGAREESVFGESEGHARGGEHSAVEQSHVGDHGSESEPSAEKWSADKPAATEKIIAVPGLPVAERREEARSGKEIGGHRERDNYG